MKIAILGAFVFLYTFAIAATSYKIGYVAGVFDIIRAIELEDEAAPQDRYLVRTS